MKTLKLLFAFVIGLALIAATPTTTSAQAAGSFRSQYGNLTDTVVNAGAKRLTIQGTTPGAAVELVGYQKSVAVQFNATEISGTTAGTAALQGSLDGANWFTIGTPFTLTDLANQSAGFVVADWPYRFLSVLVTGTGTMSDIVSARYVARQVK